MLRKEIKNSPIPWLSFIVSGFKTYEGRLANKIEEWDLYVGKKMIFYCEGLEVEAVVTRLCLYKSFGDAFDELGSKLVPIVHITRQEVEELYREYFTDANVAKHGVVAIKLDVRCVRRI